MSTDQVASLTTRANLDCRVICDGDHLLLLKANQIKKINVPVGTHILQYISVENPALYIEKVMDFPIAGRNYLLLLDDMKGLVKKEAEARERAEAEAREEARRIVEEEERAKVEAKAKEEARQRAEEEARGREEMKAREEARRKVEEEERARAEARFKAEEEVQDNPSVKKTIRILSRSGIGAKYEGFVKNDQPCGKGKAYYDNGDIYEGDWENGVHHGSGIYSWADGRKYEGEWKDGVQSGIGKFQYRAGRQGKVTYEGEWKDGDFNGQGLIVYGDYYRVMANWKDGQIIGSFRRYYNDGTYEDCEGGWVNNIGGVIREGKAVSSTGQVGLYEKNELLVVGNQNGFCYKLGYFRAIVYYQEDFDGEKVPLVYRNEVYMDYQAIADIYNRLSDYDDAKRYGRIRSIEKPTMQFFQLDMTARTPYLYLLFENTDHILSAPSKDTIIKKIRYLLTDSHRNRGDYSYSAIEDVPDYFDGDYYMDGRTRYSIIEVIVRDLPDYFLTIIKQ